MEWRNILKNIKMNKYKACGENLKRAYLDILEDMGSLTVSTSDLTEASKLDAGEIRTQLSALHGSMIGDNSNYAKKMKSKIIEALTEWENCIGMYS